MIAKLRGIVDTLGDDFAIILVGGIGYLVFCSARTLQGLPRIGDATELVIETHVREDHIHLYGFATSSERDWFQLLTSVQGVGAKMGLAILSALNAAELQTAILSGDKNQLSRANGVGAKLAQRIATELKDKAAKTVSNSHPASANIASTPTPGSSKILKKNDTNDTQRLGDAASALVNLGYSQSQAFTAVAAASQAISNAGVEDLIRLGLKELAAK